MPASAGMTLYRVIFPSCKSSDRSLVFATVQLGNPGSDTLKGPDDLNETGIDKTLRAHYAVGGLDDLLAT